jgi:adenine-specific DNA-methyltransferase
MATATLVEHAHAAGKTFMERVTREEQKAEGQFWTPPGIALFMARRLVAGVDTRPIRVLEPAAGAGILAAAVLDVLLERPVRPSRVELLLCEKDPRLLPVLEALAVKAKAICAEAGVDLDVAIEIGDFLLSERVVKGEPIEGLLTISNPPFFKLAKSSAQAQAHPYAVYGQPNIYGLFMAATARLTGKHGRWCFITPRSWMSGSYFGAVRRTILRHLTLESLHAFESRTEGFAEDEVLQETVIAWGAHRPQVEPGYQVLLSRSAGVADLDDMHMQALPIERLVNDDDGHAVISIPADGHDPFEGWTATLATYGLQVSTGPVVAFRATEYIREHKEAGTVPLLWLQHVKQQAVQWPVQKKREHIKAVAGSAWMMVKNSPMVLMHRFSPNEAERRVRCAAYEGQLPGAVVGLENHLNYIFRPSGSMSVAEARGLSALLASEVVDKHFRALAGSTQVNARDLRALPLPPLRVIVAIGERLPAQPTLAQVDTVVAEALGLHALVSAQA